MPISDLTQSSSELTASASQLPEPRLIQACKKIPLDRPPVWLMRQAGRYMKEYRAIREKVSFLDLCKTPALAAEVSLQPYQTFGMDGVIMFCDILIPPEAMGMELLFTEKGPVLPTPLRTAEQIHNLIIPDPLEKTGFVMDLLKTLRKELAKEKTPPALIGFAGAPWTLASYMIEGGVSRNFTELKKFMYNDPALLHLLLDKLADTVIVYLNAQIEAGAQMVQLFDTWAGIVTREQYKTFIQPYQAKVIAGIHRDKAPVVLYANGSRGILDLMAATNPDVISLDWLTSLTEARETLGKRFALQGNLDTNALFSNPSVLEPLVEAMILEGGPSGYIANLGHGILPTTPVENVRLLVDTVKNYRFPQ